MAFITYDSSNNRVSSDLFGKFAAFLAQALDVRRQRVRLEELDDRLLEDIGIDTRSARIEARRPFWDFA